MDSFGPLYLDAGHPVRGTDGKRPIPWRFAGTSRYILFLSKADCDQTGLEDKLCDRQGRQPEFSVVPRQLLPTSLGRNQALQEVHLQALRSVWRCPGAALKLCRRLHFLLRQYAPGLCTKLNFYCGAGHCVVCQHAVYPLEA